MSILTISTDGSLIWDQNFPEDFLKYSYKMINCTLVDRISLSKTVDMWVDDEGMFTQDVNPAATVACRAFGYPANAIYGPAVVCGLVWGDDGIDAGPLGEEDLYKVMNIVNKFNLSR